MNLSQIGFLGQILLVTSLTGCVSMSRQLETVHVRVGSQAFEVEVASTLQEQQQGLGGRSELAEDRGMLFPYDPPQERTFWMKGMLIPIDLLWIRDGLVVGIEEQMSPDGGSKHYSSPGPVDYVLELRTGSVEQFDITVGNSLHVETSTPGT